MRLAGATLPSSTDRGRFPASPTYPVTGMFALPSQGGKYANSIRPEEEHVGRRGKTSGEDKREGAMDKAKGRLKEAAGALSGDEVRKSEGRSDQRKGTLKQKKGHLKDLFK
jgi:uncharacterized protein YjbJ (UPF0337 family)